MAYQKGFSCLNAYQKDILEECHKKKNGGLALPMGSGKTLLSLVLGLRLTEGGNVKRPILVVVAKTLLMNWKDEIEKFFGSDLKYCVLHPDFIKGKSTSDKIESWKIPDDVRVVLTTSNIITKYYTVENIESKFVETVIMNRGTFNQHEIINYRVPNAPYSGTIIGPGILYSMKWGCLIVDEIQKFTNATTKQCRGLAAICANYRWGLSGTMFDEPKIERILGYHLIINHPTFPRTLPDAQRLLYSYEFKGVKDTIVQRKNNDAFQPPVLKEVIINHELGEEEKKVYLCMRDTVKKLNDEVRRYQIIQDTVNVRRFSSYILAMITYLRQSIVSPLLPIANVALDVSSYEDKSILSDMLLGVIQKLDIDTWLNDESSVLSSRIQEVLRVLKEHEGERVVVFTSFRTCLDMIQAQLEKTTKERQVFALTATMTTKTRGKTLEAFNESENGVLLMTYDLGAEGLNIQSSHTVLLVDLWWNAAKTQQAICRVFRFGQESPVVNAYYFTSNTGIEKALLDKHSDKLNVLEEIKSGPLKSTVKNINIKDILKILNVEENNEKLVHLNRRLK